MPGFRFSALKGLLEAIEANFKDIKVNGGTFDEVTVNGIINATGGVFGPMAILNDNISKPNILTFGADQTYQDVWIYLITNMPEGQFVNGTYMNKIIINIKLEPSSPNIYVIFTYSDNTTKKLNIIEPFGSTLTLTYQFIGKKITIQNIPNTAPKDQPNCIWRDNNGFLRIT